MLALKGCLLKGYLSGHWKDGADPELVRHREEVEQATASMAAVSSSPRKAGEYRKGEKVQYYSASNKSWVECVVDSVRSDGRIGRPVQVDRAASLTGRIGRPDWTAGSGGPVGRPDRSACWGCRIERPGRTAGSGGSVGRPDRAARAGGRIGR